MRPVRLAEDVNHHLRHKTRRLVGLVAVSFVACGDGVSDPQGGVLGFADSGAIVAPPNMLPTADAGVPGAIIPDAAVGQMGSVSGTPPRDAGAALEAGTVTSIGQADSSTDAGPSTTGGGDGAVPGGARPKPFCVAKDSQVMVIGDSYINWISHSFPDDIKRESGQSWRMEAVGGTSMGSGGIGFIPSQFDDSIAADPDAHTVLMDGGGNDVLVPDPTLDLFGECTNTGSSKSMNCQQIVKIALDAADKMMNRMVGKGIRDVIYFFYPHVPANTILTGNNPNEILDYALPMVRDFCVNAEQRTGGKLRCTFIDLVPVFQGHNNWFNEDIHPNTEGGAAIAKKVWEVMKDKCIGQKGPKDCCESK